jgi:hypothetical protein
MMTMPKGGARTKSGPARDPNSRSSERVGFTATSLPSSGYDGEIPELADYMPRPTLRHKALWEQLWRTPQACMWDRDRWMIPMVADLVRCQVRSEAKDAPAAWETPIQQKRTELGLTTSGMRFLGWEIKHDELASKREEKATEPAPVKRERRLRSANAQ